MKKFLCIAIVIVLCSLSLGAFAEPATDDVSQGYGSFFEVGGLIGAYCNAWDKTIGKSFGSDMTLDVSNMSIIEQTDDGFTMDVDGIIFETDSDFYISSMRVCVTGSEDTYRIMSRTCGIIAILCYETPDSASAMTSLFSEIFEKYVDALELCTHFMQLLKKDWESEVIEGNKGAIMVYFRMIDGNMYFCVE